MLLDSRFEELLKTLLADHPVHLDLASLAYLNFQFAEGEKLGYQGESDDLNFTQFICFNPSTAGAYLDNLVNAHTHLTAQV